MLVKDISYLELCQPFCSTEQNHLCNFGRGCLKGQFCEIILNLDLWDRRRCHLKICPILSSGNPPVRLSGTICAIFKEGIMGNIHVKFYEIWTSS